MANDGHYTTQEQAIRAFGAEICAVVRHWRPVVGANKCPFCGMKYYHIIPHVAECALNPAVQPPPQSAPESDWSTPAGSW